MSMQMLRRVGVTMCFVWLGCLAFVVLEQFAGALTFREFSFDPLPRIRFITLYFWLPFLAFAPLVALLSARVPISPGRWLLPLAAHIALLLALTLVHSLVIAYAYHYAGELTPVMATYEPWQHSGHFMFADDGFLFVTCFYIAIAASFNIRGFIDLVRGQEQQASALQASLAEHRLQTLRMQINPHFLFNVLNSIAVLIRKGEFADAGKTVNRLAGMLRDSLRSPAEQVVTLREELECVRRYLYLVHVRFRDRLEVVEDIDSALLDVRVPSMLLQPLVENAVEHGLGSASGGCRIVLSAAASGRGRLRLAVVDNGAGGRFYEDPAFREGIGLSNVRGRLQLIYGGVAQLRIAGRPGGGTQVVIELPDEVPSQYEVAV